MKIRAHALLALAAVLLAGCLVEPNERCDLAGGPIHCDETLGLICDAASGACTYPDGGSPSISTGTNAGSGTSGTSSSTGGSGGTTGDCGGVAAPAIHCARADGASNPLVVGETPVIRCSVDPGLSPASWSASVSPSFFTADARSAPDSVFVNLVPSNVPASFGDTDVQVTVAAQFCGSASSTDVVHLPVVGNILGADHFDGNVKVFTSGGSARGLFGSGTVTGNPNMLAMLANGNVLVGSSTQLVELTRAGAPVTAFDTTDHSGQPLFGNLEPWGAAEASNGDIWVTANSGRDSNGAVYRYSASGLYQDVLPAPTGATPTYWLPMSVARRADGAMLVTSGDEHSPPYVAVYPMGSTAGTYAQAGFQACTASGCTSPTFSGMGISGLWLDPDGTLFLTNIWEDDNDADLAAFDATSFAFERGSIHPTTGLDPMYNEWLRGVTRAGDRLLVAVWNGCIWGVDPQTLMPLPAGPGVDASGCVARGFSDLRAIVHFGP